MRVFPGKKRAVLAVALARAWGLAWVWERSKGWVSASGWLASGKGRKPDLKLYRPDTRLPRWFRRVLKRGWSKGSI